jgi:hypothetical protein
MHLPFSIFEKFLSNLLTYRFWPLLDSLLAFHLDSKHPSATYYKMDELHRKEMQNELALK